MKEVVQKALAQLLSSDPILGDLHADMTHQEVCGLLEVEAGRSMLVQVRKADGATWDLRVPRDARLHQLKAALKTHVTLHMHRCGLKRALSWRSMWRRHWLVLSDGTKLTDDNATLSSLGVKHKCTLSFVKRNRDKCFNR
uniref:U11/U12 small nuclear ribonucleoprotein 25 kDa protein-like n=1 Tax=Hirondellea gigas TaxID=1518452 RepID=A0A6A7FQT7_9CRUS